jgi:hypothetical protein
MPTPLRTSGFSCSRVELPLPMHMRCQSMADRTPLLAQDETLLDLTAPVRALLAYLHNHSQGRRSCSASTPSASNLLARGWLLCIRTRLQKRAESTTGKTLPLALANAPIRFRSDLRFLQLRRPFHLLGHHQGRPTTVAGLALHVKPASRCFRLDRLVPVHNFFFRAWRVIFATSASARAVICRIRVVPSAAFSSTASNVHHA